MFYKAGITPAMYRHTIGILKGFFNLMPKDTFNYFSETEWMKAVHKRIAAEQKKESITTGTVVDLLPQPTEICMPGFKSRDEFCKFGLVDMSVFGEIEGKEVTVNNIKDIFKEYACVDYSDKVLESVEDDLFKKLPNVGVQTNIVFTSAVQTMYEFIFDQNPKPETDKDKYVTPTSNKFTHGDGAVLVTSAIIPGFKWMNDFKYKVAGAKPVNLIEVCSTYKRRTSVFSPNYLQVIDNAYFGIDCDCAGTKSKPSDGSKCNHTTFVSDAKVISFLLNSAIDGKAAVETAASKTFADKTETQLEAYEA